MRPSARTAAQQQFLAFFMSRAELDVEKYRHQDEDDGEKAVFAVSDHAQWMARRVSSFGGPSVSETGVVFDMVETGVDIAELLADTLDEGAYIGAIPFEPCPAIKSLPCTRS